MRIQNLKTSQYTNRDERNQFIAETFKTYIGETVLNIGGGGKKHLAQYLPKETNYFELDIDGEPDLKINLETELPIPVADNSYHTVVCTDVLEHLDSIYEIFGELARVADRHIIISLPNPVRDSLAYFFGTSVGKTGEQALRLGARMKYYGLPLEKPVDRHRWFFSYHESVAFYKHQAQKHNLEISEQFYVENTPNTFSKKLVIFFLKLVLGKKRSEDIFPSSSWVVFTKKS